MDRSELLEQLAVACRAYRFRVGEDIADPGVMRVLRELDSLLTAFGPDNFLTGFGVCIRTDGGK